MYVEELICKYVKNVSIHVSISECYISFRICVCRVFEQIIQRCLVQSSTPPLIPEWMFVFEGLLSCSLKPHLTSTLPNNPLSLQDHQSALMWQSAVPIVPTASLDMTICSTYSTISQPRCDNMQYLHFLQQA